MDSKRPPLAGDGGQVVFNLGDKLFLRLVQPGLVQHFRQLVTGEHQLGKAVPRGFIVYVDVGTPHFRKPPLAVLQYRRELAQGIKQIIFPETHMAFLVPYFGEVHAALEVGYIDLRPLVKCLHKQELQQIGLAGASGAAQEDKRDGGEVYRHRPR